jgi:hypothetical protein
MPGHHRLRTGLLAVPILGAALLVPAGSATAVSAWPTIAPTHVRTTTVAATSYTVAMDKASNITGYRLWTSRSKDDLYVSSLKTARSGRRVVTTTSPALTASGLPYAAAPYYYRVATFKGGNFRYSPILSASLRPTVPTSVLAVDGPSGLALTWNSVSATRFEVMQSTDPAMLAGRRQYVIRGQNNQLTPYGLTLGSTYYFRVRAHNGPTASPWSAKVSAAVTTSEVNLRVMTYNLLILVSDGTRGGGGAGEVIAPWNTKRKAAAATLVKRGNPDVIAVQEGSAYTYGWNTPRQVDSFASALGSSYTVARTQGFPGDSDYVMTGSHIVYRNTTYQAVGNGGHWDVGGGKWAAWQVLSHRGTGREFLVVSTHLNTLTGATYDAVRRTQTQNVVDRARALATGRGGIPIVYGGDFGSVKMSWHPDDTPGAVMRSTRAADAWNVAQTVVNGRYSSVNQYKRVPVVDAGSYDRIFGSPGVAIRRWDQLLTLSAGKFVGTIPSDHNPVIADITLRAAD